MAYPALPRKIGIVTSIDGAALRDIIKVLARRYPDAHLVIAPTRVQGEGAAEEIAAAIRLLNEFNAAQLKTIQEVITLVVFCIFSVFYLKEPLKWNYLAGFALMAGGVFVIFKEW